MTIDQQQRLDTLRAALDKAVNDYNIEVTDNARATEGWIKSSNTAGSMWDGHPREWWEAWKNGSDASLAAKKIIMDNADKAYNSYKADVKAQDDQAFQQAHPEIALQLQQAQIQAQNDLKALELKNQLEKEKANYSASSTKMYLYGAIAFVVIISGTFIFYFTRKTASA